VQRQIEWKDRIYTENFAAQLSENTWIVQVTGHNRTRERTCLTFHWNCRFDAPVRVPAVPRLPAGSVWADALDFLDFTRKIPRFDDAMVSDARRRGEMIRPGAVRNACIRLQAATGDRIRLAFPGKPVARGPVPAVLRYFADAPAVVRINGTELAIDPEDCLQEFLLEIAPEITMESLSGSIDADGIALDVRRDGCFFAPAWHDHDIEFTLGPVPGSAIFRHPFLREAHGFYWGDKTMTPRLFRVPDMIAAYHHDFGKIAHTFRSSIGGLSVNKEAFGKPPAGEPDWETFADIAVPPQILEPRESFSCYGVFTSGTPEEVEDQLRRIAGERKHFPLLVRQARTGLISFRSTPAGRKYRFGQERMLAVVMTNLLYPVQCCGKFIRHHSPGKCWNSLYTWDSGFHGLGLLEVSRKRAAESLNVYLTPPEDREHAMIHHGSPLPTQFYLFMELMNRGASMETAQYFYPRLKHCYDFFAGRAPGCTIRGRSGHGLLRGWDYFDNSGGWDDYPPQVRVHRKQWKDIAPAVLTSHFIRMGKILLTTAEELGLDRDLPQYLEDGTEAAELLQKYSWDPDEGIFSYVRHDEKDRPCGIFRHESGRNFNFGLDGASPLIAGICTGEQAGRLWSMLEDSERCWTQAGLSTVDRTAPYYREDGYWNGGVWMPHQWFFWKAALDCGKGEFARRIALTALDLWEKDVRSSYACHEHFPVLSGLGGGWHHFAGLSAPVLSWFSAYFVPGRLSGGMDCTIRDVVWEKPVLSARIRVAEGSGRSSLIAVTGKEDAQVYFNGKAVPAEMPVPGTVEFTLPRGAAGKLEIQ